MKKKYKLKKSAIVTLIFIFVLIIALITFIVSLLSKKSYSIDYSIDEYDIRENYDSKEHQYYYEISYNNQIYSFIYESEYLKETKLIYDIKEYKEKDYVCLEIKSDLLKTNPLCSYKKELIDHRLVPEELKEKIKEYYYDSEELSDSYKNYIIYNKDNKVLIWSYKGFYYLNGNKREFIQLFDKDIYEIPLSVKINNYLVVPNYEQQHNFNEVYIINLENLKVKKWELKYEISYDSYIVGTNKESIFLVDKKNKKEYELVPHKEKMRIVGTATKQGIIYENGESEKISITKLVSQDQNFTYKRDYNYTLTNNNLYLSYLNSNNKIRVSDKKVNYIVGQIDKDIFYLVEDTLYRYNDKYGEMKVIKYSEWSFNYKNLIFIIS